MQYHLEFVKEYIVKEPLTFKDTNFRQIELYYSSYQLLKCEKFTLIAPFSMHI